MARSSKGFCQNALGEIEFANRPGYDNAWQVEITSLRNIPRQSATFVACAKDHLGQDPELPDMRSMVNRRRAEPVSAVTTNVPKRVASFR